jgi:pimeloyl-ACP methyl ester carboxylesterase
MNIDLNYGQLIPELTKNRQVIALELQGHGRTADIDRPFSFPALADDVAGLLKYLKIDSADVLGYSMGATIALELAIQHPEMVKKLIFISSVYKFDGWIQAARDIFPTIKPEFLENTPLKTDYDQLAPDKEHWKTFVAKLTKFGATPFDLGAANIKSIKSPVMIIKGDNDGVELTHVAEMYSLLGGGVFADMTGLPKSQLAIIPGTTHVSLMMETQKLAALIVPFLH